MGISQTTGVAYIPVFLPDPDRKEEEKMGRGRKINGLR
jgi:hypothetical protein